MDCSSSISFLPVNTMLQSEASKRKKDALLGTASPYPNRTSRNEIAVTLPSGMA
jgi:hypothetical protein